MASESGSSPADLSAVPALFCNVTMRRWPDKIARAVTFDVAFALDFKVGRSAPARRPGAVVAKSIVDYLQLSNWVI